MKLTKIIFATAFVSLILVFLNANAEDAKNNSTEKNAHSEQAIFAGGCFWCMESPFADIPGVTEITVGYAGGTSKNPTYEEVSAGSTGHAEVVQVKFNPEKVSYAKLVDIFWRQIDPLAKDSQFCDHGSQYRSAIFYADDTQKKIAEASLVELEKSGTLKGKIVTEISKVSQFFPAEEYHQHYYKKNPIRYKFYRSRCGRDERLEMIWGKSQKSHG